MTDDWDDDVALLTALDAALEAVRSMPADFARCGRACFGRLNLDAELARLVHDSSADLCTIATVRAERAVVRALTFVARSITVEVEIGADALRGQLVPHQPGEVELVLPHGGSVRERADELGYFLFRHVPTTSFRLVCRTDGDLTVATTWVTCDRVLGGGD